MGSTKTFDKYNMFIVYDGLIKNYQLTLLEILRSDVMREKYNEELKTIPYYSKETIYE